MFQESIIVLGWRGVGQLFTCLFCYLYTRMSAFCVASYAGHSVFALECLIRS
jgi:hypothetical protein